MHLVELMEPDPQEELPYKTPRSLVFKMLAFLWIFPSFGAIWILASGWRRIAEASGIVGKLQALAADQWVALLLLLLHLVFIVMAQVYHRKEAK